MLKQEELCGNGVVADFAKPATTPLKAAEETLSAQVSYPNQPALASIKCKLSNIVQQRRTCGSHPAAGCSTGVCHRAAFQSPSNLSSSQLLKLSNCYRAAFIAAPFRRCARPLPAPAATGRKRPPHPPRRLPHSKLSHKPPHAAHARPHRWQRCSSRRCRFTCHHSAHSNHTQHQHQHPQQLTKAATPHSIC